MGQNTKMISEGDTNVKIIHGQICSEHAYHFKCLELIGSHTKNLLSNMLPVKEYMNQLDVMISAFTFVWQDW